MSNRQAVISTPLPASLSTPRVPKARSLPSPTPFRLAVFWLSLHYLGLVLTVTAFACFILEPSRSASLLIIAGVVTSGVAWFVAIFKRRSARCPLCQGTPLINSGAEIHSRAARLQPLNEGVTATFSIMATQTFRCMYCGSNFDLLKQRAPLTERPAEQS